MIVRSAVAAVILATQVTFTPARLTLGGTPVLPRQVIGGGEVLLEVTVGVDGRIGEIVPLRVTPPFDAIVLATIRDWRFSPAELPDEDGVMVAAASRILVAAVFRPPTLINAPVAGEPSADVELASDEIPFPGVITPPLHPPGAIAEGVVLVEARIDEDGAVSEATVIGPGQGFDQAATDSVRQWGFRPASLDGRATPSYVYVIVGFPQPVFVPGP